MSPQQSEAPLDRHACVAPVLLVSEIFPPALGGSGVLLANIYARLKDVDVVVLTDAPAQAADGAMTRVRVRVGTRHWGVAHPAGLLHHLRLAGAIRWRSVRHRSAVHCARALPEGIAALIARAAMAGAPVVCWAHGEDIATALESRELTAVMKTVYHSAAATIANSENTSKLVLGLGIHPSKVHVVHPGVDANRFRPGPTGHEIRRRLLREGGHLLLSVGRLQRRKGQDTVIRAVGALKDVLPSLRYAIVGDGAERVRLAALARELGVDDRVAFEGAVSDEELPAYYAAADLFVMPNRVDGRDVEGFGIVFLEAAAAALPVIGGATGGVPEALDAGKTGLLVSGEDVAELAAAIARLVEDEGLRQRMGHAGRERVLRRFTWEGAAAAVQSIHDRVTGQ